VLGDDLPGSSWSQRNGWAATIAASWRWTDLQQILQGDSRPDLEGVSEPVAQEMPFARRDLDACQNDEPWTSRSARPAVVGLPEVVVLGNHHRVETGGFGGAFDQGLRAR